jgi:predicted MFS family arabinose efflux permease
VTTAWADNRWFILGALFVARFCLGYQFQSAGSIAPFVISDFDLDYSQIGTLVGLYMLPGLVVALPAGVLGKRFGDKRVVNAGLFLMIVGGIFSGVGESYATVSTGRVISGIGAAFLFVLMTKMLTDWFAERELFIAMSIFIIGWPVGIAAAQATQAQIAQVIGWRWVFHLTAGMLAAALATMAAFYRNAPKKADAGPVTAARLNGREIWLVCIAGAIWMFIASLPAEIMRPENRGPGFGIYYLWYYAGSALTPAVGGLLRDFSGTTQASVLFAVAMMFASLCLLGMLRREQVRLMMAR